MNNEADNASGSASGKTSSRASGNDEGGASQDRGPDATRSGRAGRAFTDPAFIRDLARRLAAGVPDSVRAMRADLQQNFEVLLQNALGRLDLVTREEFDVQRKVLERTREKLERLETTLAQLEQAVAAAAGHDDDADGTPDNTPDGTPAGAPAGKPDSDPQTH